MTTSCCAHYRFLASAFFIFFGATWLCGSCSFNTSSSLAGQALPDSRVIDFSSPSLDLDTNGGARRDLNGQEGGQIVDSFVYLDKQIFDLPAPSCNNGRQDGKETDIDCGGGVCPTCGEGQKCTQSSDCNTYACIKNVCSYATSCLELFSTHKYKTDGIYPIKPLTDKFNVYCDMTLDGGGWTLVGKGRQGWLWSDDGQGISDQILNMTDYTVAYLSTPLVRAIANHAFWDKWPQGLRIKRTSGVNDRWFITPKAANVAFSWFEFEDNRHGCGTIANKKRAAWKQIGGSGLSGEADLVDNWSTTYGTAISGNDCNRIFTGGWGSHSCYKGFSTGSSCVFPNEGCWTFATEEHCIPQTTVWVR